MELILYKTLDSDSVINKTLIEPISIQINLKRDTDIVSPNLILAKVVGVEFKDYNYLHLADLGRYYFIRRVSVLNNSVYSLECECDYLESYRDGILNSLVRYDRAIKVGDYIDVNIDKSLISNSSKHLSNVSLVKGSTMILTSLGG